jgi:hypothetical protein
MFCDGYIDILIIVAPYSHLHTIQQLGQRCAHVTVVYLADDGETGNDTGGEVTPPLCSVFATQAEISPDHAESRVEETSQTDVATPYASTAVDGRMHVANMVTSLLEHLHWSQIIIVYDNTTGT